jgi:Phosphotransferase enzyme family
MMERRSVAQPDPPGRPVSHETDEDALRRCVERIAADGGERPAIARIDRRRSDHSSSYVSDVVTIRLAGGEEFRLFLKDFGSSQFYKEEPRRQRDRELRVYRELLGGAGLGTARYHGSMWGESGGRFWLVLEFVGGTPLAYCEFEYWVAAAGWLGRLHGYFAEHADRLRACDFLLRHDADFFWSKARLALATVSTISPPLADRLANVLSRYEACVEVMVSQPPTLVHGGYKPRHILVDVTSQPPGICPVDWELAATGSSLYDLAFLAYGLDSPHLDRLLDAYRHESLTYDLPLPGREQMRHAMDCFRLHRVLKALGGAQRRELPESTVAKLVESGERLSHLVC